MKKFVEEMPREYPNVHLSSNCLRLVVIVDAHHHHLVVQCGIYVQRTIHIYPRLYRIHCIDAHFLTFVDFESEL